MSQIKDKVDDCWGCRSWAVEVRVPGAIPSSCRGKQTWGDISLPALDRGICHLQPNATLWWCPPAPGRGIVSLCFAANQPSSQLCSHVGYCRCGLEPEPVTSAHIKHLHSILHLGLRKKIYVILALPLIVPIYSKVVWEVKEARAVLSFRLCFAVCWPSKLLIELWIEFIDSLMSHLSQMPLRGGNIYSNFPSTFS